MTSLGRIGMIGANTFLEAVRQKFVGFLLILSLGLIASSNFFRQFNFEGGELKFIADFGFGAILLFGSIVAIVAAAQLFFSEIENRTALTILAKPVHRREFVAGKFVGVALMLLAFTALMTLLLAVMLWLREGELVQDFPAEFPDGRVVDYPGVAAFALLQWLRFCILSAITIFIASFSNTNLYSVVVAFFIMLICQLQYIAADSWSAISSPLLRWPVYLLSLIFPNLQMFNVGDLLILTDHSLSWLTVAAIAVYAMVYIVAFTALAVFSFRNREI